MHVCLSNLSSELTLSALHDLKLAATDRAAIYAICLKNAEIAIRNLRLHMQPTFENIEALMHGVGALLFSVAL